jgi:2-octaprenyl-6-methoxyphenol hydroxylase
MADLADIAAVETETADVVIIGGGPVGSALVLALQRTGWRIVLLEARTAATIDARPLALSYGTRLILERLGVWPALAVKATPIRHIHVSQQGGFGRAGLEAAEAGLPELGYVIDYAALARELARATTEASAADCRMGARVAAWHGGDPARVDYEMAGVQRTLTASLVVVADGSGVVDADTVDYQQCAVTARVVSERPHNNTAYERFTPHGPLALLPDGTGWALVWTTSPTRAQLLCELDAQQFLAELRAEFGSRVGDFTAVSGRASYPLRLRRAPRASPDHTVLIGNAAQTLHPVAGQGFNLGLRDAWELAEHALNDAAAPGSAAWLKAYHARRNIDRGGGIGMTHALVQLFSNDLPPLRIARGLGLTLLGCVPPLKNFLVRRMTFGARG